MTAATTADIQQILNHHLALLDSEQDVLKKLPPIMLWGPPGVGKSAVVRDLCERNGIGFRDIRLSQREPVDLRGLPVPKGDRVEWLISSDWPREPDSRGIIFFDELTAADRSLQVAAYELILDRRLGDLYQVPPGWLIVAAGNRSEDRAVAHTLSSALANRFCHFELEPDLESWCGWAAGAGLHPDIIAFLRFRPECFFSMKGDLERGWPSPRSWERVSHSIALGDALNSSVMNLVIGGLVGAPVATEFQAFRHWSAQLPDVAAMLRGDIPIGVPDRADQRYAFCAAVAHYLWRAPDNQLTGRLDRFFKIGEHLSSDFATLALLDAMVGPDSTTANERTAMLFAHDSFEAWSQRHGTVFSRHIQSNQRAA